MAGCCRTRKNNGTLTLLGLLHASTRCSISYHQGLEQHKTLSVLRYTGIIIIINITEQIDISKSFICMSISSPHISSSSTNTSRKLQGKKYVPENIDDQHYGCSVPNILINPGLHRHSSVHAIIHTEALSFLSLQSIQLCSWEEQQNKNILMDKIHLLEPFYFHSPFFRSLQVFLTLALLHVTDGLRDTKHIAR